MAATSSTGPQSVSLRPRTLATREAESYDALAGVAALHVNDAARWRALPVTLKDARSPNKIAIVSLHADHTRLKEALDIRWRGGNFHGLSQTDDRHSGSEAQT